MGAERFSPFGIGNENVSESLNGSIEADFDHWCEGVLHLIKETGDTKLKKSGCSKGNDCCSKKGKKKSNNRKERKNDLQEQDFTQDSDSDLEEPVVDLEDLGSFVRVENKPDDESDEDGGIVGGEVREMLTPQLRESLSKQGYKLIGTHSGVKLCRWTKVKSILAFIFNFTQLLHVLLIVQSRQCYEVGEDVTSTHFMALKVIAVWKLHLVLLVQTNVCFVGAITQTL